LQSDNFGLYNISAGEIRAFLALAESKTLPDGLAGGFRLKFKALQTGVKLSDVLQLNAAVLPAEAYRSDFTPGSVTLVYESASTGTNQPGTIKFDLLQNVPNPFNDNTVIGFVLPEACEAQMRIFDVSGRLIEDRKATFQSGYNEMLFEFGARTGSGVLYYELTTPFGVLSKKMMQMQ
jgi:hypothetical protein